MRIRQFERREWRETHIVCGHFNEDEVKHLKLNGYKETWGQREEMNKNGIPISRVCEV